MIYYDLNLGKVTNNMQMSARKFLFLLAALLGMAQADALIIENKKVVNREFDIWRVSCQDDEMLSEISCRLFVEVTDGTTLFVNPHSSDNPILLTSKDGYHESKYFIKLDKNELITSRPLAGSRYGIVNFSPEDLQSIYRQIKEGQNFYIRFTIRDITSPNGYKEITAKFSLAEFHRALNYFENQVNKYNLNIN
jgi:hypothetical protein